MAREGGGEEREIWQGWEEKVKEWGGGKGREGGRVGEERGEEERGWKERDEMEVTVKEEHRNRRQGKTKVDETRGDERC